MKRLAKEMTTMLLKPNQGELEKAPYMSISQELSEEVQSKIFRGHWKLWAPVENWILGKKRKIIESV